MSAQTLNLVWVILLLPLAGALVQAFIGGRVIAKLGPERGRRVMGTLAVIPIAAGFVLGALLTQVLIGEPPAARSHIATLCDWINVFGPTREGIRIPFEALIDPLSMTMVLIITGVGALIHLYATGYMGEERDYSRFFTYLNLFISCMLILVLANNLVLMFIGWEGVGLCSYLLIGFWYKDISNAKAANKAFIVNRIGDWGLTLGMFLLFAVLVDSFTKAPDPDGRVLSYDVIYRLAGHAFQSHPWAATAIALLLFVGACGKSAQFPLYFWLPDAMAGPTPVSALIHAATMVTAGVFMLNRMHIFFEQSALASVVVAAIGAFTALFAALVAFGQTDIKKVLAYSTVSQLGFMFLACGAGAFWAGMFHVTTHAFFKALLFLGSGAVIHAMAHNQDMRNYGGLIKYLKITGWTMVIGFIAIAGVPGFSGFFSKEAILGAALGNEQAVVAGYNFGQICGWVGLFVAMLTAWYMMRLTMLTFFGKEERWRAIEAHHAHAHHEHAAHAHEGHHEDPHGFFYSDAEMEARKEPEPEHHELDSSHQPHEVPPSMWFPLVVLAGLSIAGGFLLANGHALENWLTSYPGGKSSLIPGLIPGEPPESFNLMYISIAAATLGILFGYFTYRKGLPASEGWDLGKWHWFRKSAANQFGYDDLVVSSGVEGGGEIGNSIWRTFDAGVVDGIVNGFGWAASQLGKGLRVIQTGYVRSYAMMMALGAVGLIGFISYLLATWRSH